MTLAIAEGVMLAIYAETGITPDDLRSKTRVGPVTHARQGIMAVLRERTIWSMPQIGKFFNRDHSTVFHAIGIVGGREVSTPSFARLMRLMRDAEPIMPGCLAQQMALVDEARAPIPEPTVAVDFSAIVANFRAVKAAETAHDALVREVNDDGFDWSGWDWRADSSYFDENRVILDDDGNDLPDRLRIKNLIAGSAKLRDAIQTARAA